MISFNAFKRLASAGSISLEMTYWRGKDIPEHLCGVRKIIHVGSKKLVLENHDGNHSDLYIRSAKLFECDGTRLAIYNPLFRELNDDERAILDEAQRIRNDYEKQYPGYDGGYWKMMDYIRNSEYPYLEGFKTIGGRKYTGGRIMDQHEKGNLILMYIIHSNTNKTNAK